METPLSFLLRGRISRSRERTGEPGDAAAKRTRFGALAREHEATLLRTARRLCHGNEDSAQDLVQEALIHAYTAFLDGRFEEGTNARAWLLRILTNDFLNDYRRRKRQATVDLETLTAGGETGPPSTYAPARETPGETLWAETLDEPLERALGALAEGLRLCVLLVDVDGLDYVEAAAVLNVPIGTVRSRLSRARLQLQKLLREYARDRRL